MNGLTVAEFEQTHSQSLNGNDGAVIRNITTGILASRHDLSKQRLGTRPNVVTKNALALRVECWDDTKSSHREELSPIQEASPVEDHHRTVTRVHYRRDPVRASAMLVTKENMLKNGDDNCKLRDQGRRARSAGEAEAHDGVCLPDGELHGDGICLPRTNSSSGIKSAPRRAGTNARYDIRGGLTENEIGSEPTMNTTVPKMSFHQRMAELEAVEKSGEALLASFRQPLNGDFRICTSPELKKVSAPYENNPARAVNSNCRRPRDTMFVAQTVNNGRQAIQNIQNAMDATSERNNEYRPLEAVSSEEVKDNASSVSLETLRSVHGQGHGESNGWSGPGIDTEMATSEVPSAATSIYNLENISIHEHLDDRETNSDVRSICSGGSSTNASARSRIHPDDSVTKATRTYGSPFRPCVEEYLSLIERLETFDEYETIRPDSATIPWLLLDCNFTLQSSSVVSSSGIINFEGTAKSGDARAEPHYQAAPALKASCLNDVPCSSSVPLPIVTGKIPRLARPNGRRRSSSGPPRVNSVLSWEGQFNRHFDAREDNNRPRSMVVVEVKQTPRPCTKATVEIIQQGSALDVASRFSGFRSFLRESTGTELAISHEDAVGIWPPFEKRSSTLSRSGSNLLKVRALAYGLFDPDHSSITRPS